MSEVKQTTTNLPSTSANVSVAFLESDQNEDMVVVGRETEIDRSANDEEDEPLPAAASPDKQMNDTSYAQFMC